MAITQFKAFGIGVGNSVTDLTTYLGSSWLQAGFPTGLLTHDDLNRVLRQATVPVAALTQLVADYVGADVNDDGDLGGLVTKFKQALSASGLGYVPGGTYPPGSLGDFLNHVNSGGTLNSDQIVALLNGVLGESELTPALQARLNQIDAPTTGLVTRVNDLTNTYGSTAAAATSASQAASSAAAALASQNAAAVSAGAALTSETNANTSKVAAATSAGAASTSASQAATSASSAAGSANTATTQATNASNSATAANNSASAAASSASSADTSATNDGTYASTAQTQAGVATTKAAEAATSPSQAATSASTAAGSASTATSQASLATTAASQAANSAAQAAAAGAAVGGVNLVVRQRFVTLVPIDLSWGLSGWGYRVTGDGSAKQVLQIDLSPLAANTPYSVSFKAKVSTGTATVNVSFQPATLPNTNITVGVDGTVTYTWPNVSSALSAWSTAQLRMDVTVPAGVTLEVTDVKVEQGTVATAYTPSPVDLRNYANAAQTQAGVATSQASNAAASANAATTSATQASTYAGQANTSAGQANTSAGQAAASASDPAGNASSAATNASNAATSANGAANSAVAATNAASNAATSAGSAQTSASAAANSATAAATGASNAGTFAGQASQAATNAANSAAAAASSYQQTVSATGDLTAQVSSVQQTQTSMNGRLQTAEANYTLKVVTTRADGKKVLGGIGIASVDNGTVQQSEILLQADRLVFVPSSNPNATPVNLLQVGTVNGVTTLVVPQAVIGDATVGNAQIAGGITANKFALPGGTVATDQPSSYPFDPIGSPGSGGGYGSIGTEQNSGYVTAGGLVPIRGRALGSITVPYDGQTIHASVTGQVGVSFGPNWSGPNPGNHGLSVIARLSLYKVTSGNQVDNASAVIFDWFNTDVTTIFASWIRRCPFVVTVGKANMVAGTYVAILKVNVDAYQYPTGPASQAPLLALSPTTTFGTHNFHMFANSV